MANRRVRKERYANENRFHRPWPHGKPHGLKPAKALLPTRRIQPNAKQSVKPVGERRGVGRLAGSSGRAGGNAVHHVRSSGSGKEAALGQDGFLTHLPPDALWVDCSTVNPSFSRQMAAEADTRGIHFIGAPVSGLKNAPVNRSDPGICRRQSRAHQFQRRTLPGSQPAWHTREQCCARLH